MYQGIIENLAKHYADMAMNPATYDYAQKRVEDLRDDQSGLFKDLPKMVKQRVEQLKGKK